ncbi:MAG: hypothetical protein ACRDHV_07170 [Actinomycetota bacterium]
MAGRSGSWIGWEKLNETKRHPEEADPFRANQRIYLIDAEGKIWKSDRDRVIPAHPDEVLEDLRSLQGAAV